MGHRGGMGAAVCQGTLSRQPAVAGGAAARGVQERKAARRRGVGGVASGLCVAPWGAGWGEYGCPGRQMQRPARAPARAAITPWHPPPHAALCCGVSVLGSAPRGRGQRGALVSGRVAQRSRSLARRGAAAPTHPKRRRDRQQQRGARPLAHERVAALDVLGGDAAGVVWGAGGGAQLSEGLGAALRRMRAAREEAGSGAAAGPPASTPGAY